MLQELTLLRLHPRLIGHIRRDVMDFPFVVDAQMVWKNVISHKNEAILAKQPIRRAIVYVVGDVKLGSAAQLNECVKRLPIVEALHLISTVRARNARDQRE